MNDLNHNVICLNTQWHFQKVRQTEHIHCNCKLMNKTAIAHVSQIPQNRTHNLVSVFEQCLKIKAPTSIELTSVRKKNLSIQDTYFQCIIARLLATTKLAAKYTLWTNFDKKKYSYNYITFHDTICFIECAFIVLMSVLYKQFTTGAFLTLVLRNIIDKYLSELCKTQMVELI